MEYMYFTVFKEEQHGKAGFVLRCKADEPVNCLIGQVAEKLCVKADDIALWTWPAGKQLKGSGRMSDAIQTEVNTIIVTQKGKALSEDPLGFQAKGEQAICIPTGPPPLPYVGNLLDVRYGKHKFPFYNIAELFKKYGKFFTLKFDFLASAAYPGVPPAFIADPEIVRQMVENEKDFPKMWTSNINKKLEAIAGNGLFTSSTTDPEWQTARPLMQRPFNEVKIKDYYDIIKEKCNRYVFQIANNINKSGKDEIFISNMNEWNCCFTFDTVIQSALNVDLGDLEAIGEDRDVDPFLPAFRTAVKYNQKFYGGWKFHHYARPFKNSVEKREYDTAVKVMFDRINDLVEQTREGKIGEGKSMLYSLLFDTSPGTKQKVKLRTIPKHMISLMVAGHETTAATIGFCLNYLAKNPDCAAKAVKEAREAMGSKGYLTFQDAGKLKYITACIRETLRMYSAVSLLQRESAHDCTVTGSDGTKYNVPEGTKMYVVLRGLHTREEDWGDDPMRWDPERFIDENLVKQRHPHSYYPFGFGVRSCIGQFFAIWEARTIIAMILNRFHVRLPDGYVMHPVPGLGAAPFPGDLGFYFSAREDAIMPTEEPKDLPNFSGMPKVAEAPAASVEDARHKPKFYILYGSNAGACEDLAYALGEQGVKFGLNCITCPLDDAIEKVPFHESSHVCIVTSTYNGHPPDNAKQFSTFLQEKHKTMRIKYALCGVGNSQWHATFMKYPKKIESLLEDSCAQALISSCMLDVSKEWTESYDQWCTSLWTSFLDDLSITPDKQVMESAIKTNVKQGLNIEAKLAEETCTLPSLQEYFEMHPEQFMVKNLLIKENKELQYGSSKRSTRYIEMELPKGTTYKTGGHIAIQPKISPVLVKEAADYLGFPLDKWVVAGIEKNSSINTFSKRLKLRLGGLLSLLELTVVPTQQTLATLSQYVPCPPAAGKLQFLASSEGKAEYEEYITKQGRTTLEVLKEYSIKLPFEIFVTLFPILKVRFYSISSSPLARGPSTCTITCGVVKYQSGTGRLHEGISSSMLAGFQKDEICLGYIRDFSSNFHLPEDASVPIIMIGPGTGVAPFIGFLEERAHLKKAGKELGEAVLFFGCRSASYDYIYQEELDDFKAAGALTDLHVAFSRDGTEKVYVQHLIEKEKEHLWKLLNKGGIVFVCGDAVSMAPMVRQAFATIISKSSERSEEEALRYIEVLQDSNRYLEDVWGS